MKVKKLCKLLKNENKDNFLYIYSNEVNAIVPVNFIEMKKDKIILFSLSSKDESYTIGNILQYLYNCNKKLKVSIANKFNGKVEINYYRSVDINTKILLDNRSYDNNINKKMYFEFNEFNDKYFSRLLICKNKPNLLLIEYYLKENPTKINYMIYNSVCSFQLKSTDNYEIVTENFNAIKQIIFMHNDNMRRLVGDDDLTEKASTLALKSIIHFKED